MNTSDKQTREDEALRVLIDAIRQAQAIAPASAGSLCVSAYIAVYGLAGVSMISRALESS